MGLSRESLPARSNHACPSESVKAMPLMVLPSNPTAEAGTSNLTQTPVGGNEPAAYLLAVPGTPQPIRSAPQIARCSQLPLESYHCSMISCGGLQGVSKT